MTAPTPPPEPEKGATMRFGDLKKMISDSVSAAVAGLTGDPAPTQQRQPLRGQPQQQRSRSVDDEVRTAVEKLEVDRKARERREQRDKGVEDKLTALEERTKEKAPVERRRVHRLMGWGE